ncbi:hypothetical protein NC652_015237 [Populus alba x Populus x berolinensis]|nr:hypothetical protein NC652_015237 [Populus alba x Populus x berolinensis]
MVISNHQRSCSLTIIIVRRREEGGGLAKIDRRRESETHQGSEAKKASSISYDLGHLICKTKTPSFSTDYRVDELIFVLVLALPQPPPPPPPSPISSIRSSCRRRRTRSLQPSMVIQDTSTTAASAVSDADTDTDSLSVSRRLILLRHAKSSWDDRSLRDHDRPLSKSGELDAAKVSQKLQHLGWIPQLILSSDALRTKETLKIMQQQVPDFLDAEVHFISSFYSIAAMDGQTADHLQQAICNYSRDDILTVMCMGHNKGWEEAASMFSGASIELNTCNAALLEAAGKSWAEAFASAGLGGWKLQDIVKPSDSPER